MRQSILLGIGTGRCGTASLAKLLNQQPDAVCSFEESPLLPWKHVDGQQVIRERFARFRLNGKARLLGDCASFYLPYIEEAIAAEPDICIVCLKRPREEVVASFCQWLDETVPLPTNHWARQPTPGWHHDPVRTRTYPQYDTQNREDGIRRYWDEYYQTVDDLVRRYPEHIRLFDTYEALNTESGLRDLLSFVGIPPERQVLAVGTRVDRPPERSLRRRPRQMSDNPMDPRRCVILVPFASSITPPCERALEELERRGYPVRRVGGYAAIDQGRNQMATDALLDGYEETMWIDADVDFHPNAIDHLRSHRLPIVWSDRLATEHCETSWFGIGVPFARSPAGGRVGGEGKIVFQNHDATRRFPILPISDLSRFAVNCVEGARPWWAEGDSPIFAANSAISKQQVFFAAKIVTVPCERLLPRNPAQQNYLLDR
jgi:hypothetical protein